MSSSTYSGRVPFAFQSIIFGDICYPKFPGGSDWPEWVKRITNPDECMPDEFYDSDNDYVGAIPLGNGWSYHFDTIGSDIVKYDDLYLTPIIHKDGHTVYEINESKYSAGGEIDLTIVSLEYESLEHFAKDFGLKPDKIQENVKVYQTL